MQASRLVAGVLSIGLVGGGAYGLMHAGSSAAASPNAICSSQLLNFSEQSDCQKQMSAAPDNASRKQIASAFQAKAAARKNGDNATAGTDSSGASNSSGGSTVQPAAESPAAAPPASSSVPDTTPPQTR